MVQYKVNKLQRNLKKPKKITIKAKKLRIPKATELVVKGAEAKPKILVKEDI